MNLFNTPKVLSIPCYSFLFSPIKNYSNSPCFYLLYIPMLWDKHTKQRIFLKDSTSFTCWHLQHYSFYLNTNSLAMHLHSILIVVQYFHLSVISPVCTSKSTFSLILFTLPIQIGGPFDEIPFNSLSKWRTGWKKFCLNRNADWAWIWPSIPDH